MTTFFDVPSLKTASWSLSDSYQVLVKDACSGMNSIFALSAIGVFYAYSLSLEQRGPQLHSSGRNRSYNDRGQFQFGSLRRF
jgi:hypothetical protein